MHGQRELRKWLSVATVAALSAAGCRTTPEISREVSSEISMGPYVTNPGQTSMTVRWTAETLDEWRVRLRVDEASAGATETRAKKLRYPADPDTRGLSLEGLADDEIGTAYLYVAQFDGLQPGTKYRYTVDFGGESVDGGFRTLASEAEPLTFIASGDSHAADVVADQFAQHDPAWIFHLGDLVHHESYGQFQSYFSPMVNDMTRQFPMAVVRGNHEQRGELLSKLFGLDPDRIYYAFEDGDVLVVALDSSVWRWENAEENTTAMLEWAEKVLTESDATWKIVAFHEPPYDLSYRRSRWGREDAMAVFRRTGVDLVLNGHAHTYQRFAPLYRPGENDEHPILLVNSSGASEVYSTLARRADPYLVAREEGNHYVVFHVDGDTLSGRALDRDGRLIDQFSIEKKDGRPGPEHVAQALPEAPLDILNRAFFRLYMEVPGGAFEPGDEFVVPITLSAGQDPIRYDFRPAADSAEAVELAGEASGEAPAGETVTVSVPLRARTRIRDLGRRGFSVPRIFLVCHYHIGDVEGVISSTRVYARAPADPEEKNE